MAKFVIPEDKEIANKLIEGQHAATAKRLEAGWVGIVLGDSNNKPGNIAFITIVLSFIGMITAISASDQSIPKMQLIASLTSLITGALGYAFGRGSREGRR